MADLKSKYETLTNEIEAKKTELERVKKTVITYEMMEEYVDKRLKELLDKPSPTSLPNDFNSGSLRGVFLFKENMEG